MAKKDTHIKVVLSATYHGKDGVIPAGKAATLPEKEARDLISQGLAREHAGQLEEPSLINPEVESLKAQLAAREEELVAVKADRDAKLQEAQEYAEGLEAKLQEAEQGGGKKAGK